MPRKKAFVVLTVLFEKEKDGRWVATCKELGTSTYGNSIDDAQEKIEEAIGLHLNTLEEVGERERFFQENNITIFSSFPGDEIAMKVPARHEVFSQPFIKQIAMVN